MATGSEKGLSGHTHSYTDIHTAVSRDGRPKKAGQSSKGFQGLEGATDSMERERHDI